MQQRPTATDLGPADPTDLIDLAEHSVQLILDLQDPSGAYPASPTFSAYRGYAWLRDGSFTAEAMSRWGQTDSVDHFHGWVSDVLLARRDLVGHLLVTAESGRMPDPGRMLPTRFTLDGADGVDDWWDFQTDGYGTWLWALRTHLSRHGRSALPWLPAVEVAVDYLCAFGGVACYDWWEEHSEHRHTSTLAAVRAGLAAAAALPGLDEERRVRAVRTSDSLLATILGEGTTGVGAGRHLVKWVGSEAVDASLAACVVPFGVVAIDDPLATATLDAITVDLDAAGGVHRFTADVFYGGGQWLLLSALMGWNRCAAGDTAAAWDYLQWVAGQADGIGNLPEQVSGHLLHSEHRQEWIDRWGPVASPLVWSHAMYLILADELGLRRHESGLANNAESQEDQA